MPAPGAAGANGGPAPPLLLAVGNELRGDDAAGLRVAERLGHDSPRSYRIAIAPAAIDRLLEIWEGRPLVVVVDAVRSGRAPGSIVRLEVGRDPWPPGLGTTSTHGLSLTEAVALGQALGRLPRRLVIYGIEGSTFGVGEELSAEVAAALPELERAVAKELGARPAGPAGPAGAPKGRPPHA